MFKSRRESLQESESASSISRQGYEKQETVEFHGLSTLSDDVTDDVSSEAHEKDGGTTVSPDDRPVLENSTLSATIGTTLSNSGLSVSSPASSSDDDSLRHSDAAPLGFAERNELVRWFNTRIERIKPYFVGIIDLVPEQGRGIDPCYRSGMRIAGRAIPITALSVALLWPSEKDSMSQGKIILTTIFGFLPSIAAHFIFPICKNCAFNKKLRNSKFLRFDEHNGEPLSADNLPKDKIQDLLNYKKVCGCRTSLRQFKPKERCRNISLVFLLIVALTGVLFAILGNDGWVTAGFIMNIGAAVLCNFIEYRSNAENRQQDVELQIDNIENDVMDEKSINVTVSRLATYYSQVDRRTMSYEARMKKIRDGSFDRLRTLYQRYQFLEKNEGKDPDDLSSHLGKMSLFRTKEGKTFDSKQAYYEHAAEQRWSTMEAATDPTHFHPEPE